MFVRKGETLGSIRVDVDPSVAEKKPKRSTVESRQPAAETMAETDAKPAAEPSPEPRPEADPPKHYDSKAVWIEWAVSQGMDRELAEDPSTTKQDLIDSYGG